MTHHFLRRFVLVVGFILLATLFLLVLTLNAMKMPTTVTSALPEGPYLVKDIMLDTADSFPSPIIPAGDKVYFFAYDEQGRNLWQSDGTDQGTYQTKDLNPSTGADPNPQPQYYPTPQYSGKYPEMVDDQLFFAADDGIHGEELWLSDGSISGTIMVKDIYTGTSSSNLINLTNINGKLFFSARDGVHGKNDLWMSDGTITHTNIVTDLVWATYMDLVEFNGKAYFAADDGIHGYELWTSDGTVQGTSMVKEIIPGTGQIPNMFHTTDTFIFFSVPASDVGGLWRSDGTFTGTIQLQDKNNYDVYSNKLGTTNQRAFYYGKDAKHGWELWVSDGTISGTQLIKDINPTGNADIEDFFPVDERMFFFANDGSHGRELWVSDGTEMGTHLVKDINLSGGSRCSFSGSYSMADLNGNLFFIATDGVDGCELWLSDGTEAGTLMVQDLNLGSSSSSPYYFAVANHTLFFTAYDDTHGRELWSLGNMAPVVKDDTAVTSMNHPITIPVIANDFDVNLDAFAISAVSQAASGAVTIDGETVVYTPDDAFIGSDTFTYTVQENGGGLTAVAQINVTVTGNRIYLPIIMHLVEN